MTRAELILGLLREKPRTFDELVALTGASEPAVRTTLSDLRKSGYMKPIPTTYVATDKEAVGGKPKIVWKAGKQPKKRLPRHAANASLTMVEKSVKTNPNSVFQLGAMQ